MSKCNFCDEQCSCHICAPCSFCTSHVECEICGQLVCLDKAEILTDKSTGAKIYACPDCCEDIE